MGWLKWGAVACVLAIIIVVTTYYIFTIQKDCVTLNLDRIQELHYEIVDTVIIEAFRENNTNITSTGILILDVSKFGKTYDIKRNSDSLSTAGPNATYSVNKNGNITDINFMEVRSENSTTLFSAAKGSSFIFPEIIHIPENGIKIPQNWYAVINFNYTIRTSTPGYSSMFQQIGFSKSDLEAVGRRSITTPAGTFNAIEIRYEKTVSWTTWELHPSTHYPRDTGEKDETQVVGTYLIEPNTGILIHTTQKSVDSRFLPNTFTLTLTDIEPPLGK